MDRDNGVTPIGKIVERLMKIHSKKNSFKNAEVKMCWEKSVGKSVVEMTQYIYIKDRSLFVRIESAPLRDFLFSNKQEIIFKMNQLLTSPIENIIFS